LVKKIRACGNAGSFFCLGGSLAGALSASEPSFHLFPALEIFSAKQQLAYANTCILLLISYTNTMYKNESVDFSCALLYNVLKG
jgi:hypothetical protein